MRQKRAHKEKAYRQVYDAKNRGRLLVMEAGRRSKRKGIAFDLDQHIEEIESRVQRQVCEMTGIPLYMECRGIRWNSPSMDRIDPTKGYVLSNVRIVCFAMNAALGSWGEEALMKVISAWLERK